MRECSLKETDLVVFCMKSKEELAIIIRFFYNWLGGAVWGLIIIFYFLNRGSLLFVATLHYTYSHKGFQPIFLPCPIEHHNDLCMPQKNLGRHSAGGFKIPRRRICPQDFPTPLSCLNRQTIWVNANLVTPPMVQQLSHICTPCFCLITRLLSNQFLGQPDLWEY